MRLISALGLTGEYSGVDNPEEGIVELWFSEAADAKRFSDAVLARTSSRKPGLRSQRAFDFGAPAYAKIRKALKNVSL